MDRSDRSRDETPLSDNFCRPALPVLGRSAICNKQHSMVAYDVQQTSNDSLSWRGDGG